jgi:hypothetical protein
MWYFSAWWFNMCFNSEIPTICIIKISCKWQKVGIKTSLPVTVYLSTPHSQSWQNGAGPCAHPLQITGFFLYIQFMYQIRRVTLAIWKTCRNLENYKQIKIIIGDVKCNIGHYHTKGLMQLSPIMHYAT